MSSSTLPANDLSAPSQAPAERLPEERRARLREALVEEAWRLMSTEGLSAMQARRVAQAAGCSVGAIYNAFPDLDDLILHANARTLRALGAQLRAAIGELEPGADLVAQVCALANAYVSFAFAQETAWRSLFDYRLTYKKPYPEWYGAAQREALSVFAEAVARHAPDQAPRLVETLWAAVHGVLAAGLDQRLHERSDAEIVAQIELLLAMIAPSLPKRPTA